MAKLGISTGTVPNDGMGDSLLDGAIKINSNFNEIYNYFGNGTNLTAIGGTWVTTSVGIHTLKNVGIGTTNPTSTLTVGGNVTISGILTSSSAQLSLLSGTNSNYSGVSTVGSLSIGSSQVISSGRELQNILSLDAATTATIESAIQSAPNNFNSLNVSGVSTLGNTVVGGATTQLIVNGDARITGILTIGSSSITLNGSSNTINVGSGITLNGSTGIISATSIFINGSSITGLGVTYITAGTGISVSQNTGNVTITATGGGGGGGESYWTSTAAGINTLSNVGVGTTNPTSALTVKGNTSLETLNVSGIATISGDGGNAYLRYGSSNAHTNFVTTYNVSQVAGVPLIFADANSVALSADTTLNAAYWRIQTIGAGVTVNGTAFTNQLNVSGISTLTSNVSVGGTINLDGGLKLTTNNPTIVGTSGTVGEIKRIGGAPFFYDGSAWREFVLSSGTPVSVPADTEWDNVVFRATFDTDFTDAKFGATPVYVSTGSTIVGAAVTIGTGAFRNDGAVGSGVSYAYRSDYDFTGSWTIEFWMYVDSGPSNNSPAQPVSLISMNSTTGIGTSGNWSLAMYGDGFANKYITWFNQNHPTYKNGTTLYNVSGSAWNSIILDKWNHFALVRESNNGTLHFYVNGIEQNLTSGNNVIDNDILDISGNGLHFGGDTTFTIGSLTFNSNETADVIFDDVRISCGVGTAGQRYNSIGISTYATFTPPTTALPTTGTLSSYVQPPGDKYGEIGLGTSPTWRGTSGVTVSQRSSGNYRVSFASSYTNYNDYFVLTQAMDQGFASYVGVARSTTHVDFAINKESDNSAVNTGSLSVQIKNHV